MERPSLSAAYSSDPHSVLPVLKRSRHMTLVLIGAAAMPACSPTGPAIVHDRYASLQDCTADWGRPEACDPDDQAQPAPNGGHWTSGGGWGGGPGSIVYRGPDYPVGERAETQNRARQDAFRSGLTSALRSEPTSHAIEHAVPSVSRGGFGSMSRFFGRLG